MRKAEPHLRPAEAWNLHQCFYFSFILKKEQKSSELWLLERFPGKLLHNSDAGPGGSGLGGGAPGRGPV